MLITIVYYINKTFQICIHINCINSITVLRASQKFLKNLGTGESQPTNPPLVKSVYIIIYCTQLCLELFYFMSDAWFAVVLDWRVVILDLVYEKKFLGIFDTNRLGMNLWDKTDQLVFSNFNFQLDLLLQVKSFESVLTS